MAYATQAAAIQAAIDACDAWIAAFSSGRDPGILSYGTPDGTRVEYRPQTLKQVIDDRGRLAASLADLSTATGTASRRTSAKFLSGGAW